jgi:MoaA/NifB/PqqE/SkfB family radical SAM enzyme
MLKKIKHLSTVLRSIYHYKKGTLRLPYLPTALWIEPTNKCNLKCIMCPNSVKENKQEGFMDLGLYQKLIDEAKGFVNWVTLCMSGEPLLHPDFPAMVRYAKENGIKTYVSTNGTVLNGDMTREILGVDLDWISFSFDGCTKETYERIRKGADFEKTISNIKDFLWWKQFFRAHTRVEIQILIMDEVGMNDYEENIASFKARFKGLPLDLIQIRQPSTWGRTFVNTKKFQPKKLSRTFSPCSYLWSSLHVLWDGRVVACTSDFFGDNVLGKFPEGTLKEIWNGIPMQLFRKSMREFNYYCHSSICYGCDSIWGKTICGLPAGIRGISAITVINVLGKPLRKLLWLLKPY